MKKLTLIVLVSLLASACNYQVPSPDLQAGMVSTASVSGTPQLEDAPADDDGGTQFSVGPFVFSEAGEVVSLRTINGEVLPEKHQPFVITQGTERHAVDSLSILNKRLGSQARVLRLRSSSLPEQWIDVEILTESNRASFKVAGVVEKSRHGERLGLESRFTLSPDVECKLGYVGFANGSHVCTSDVGTFASYCLTGNCDNSVALQMPTMNTFPLDQGPKIGAVLSPLPTRPLLGSGFVLLLSSHQFRSREFMVQVKELKETFGTRAENGSSLFLTAPPASSCGSRICPENASAISAKASRMGFTELQLSEDTWVQKRNQVTSWGKFDPIPGLGVSLQSIRAQGTCPVLHSIASALNLANPLCLLGNGSPETCPAALRNPDGTFFQMPGLPQVYFSDLNKPEVLNALVSSVADGAMAANACGTYVDGSDWFHSHPLSAAVYYEELWKRAPQLRVWGNYSHGNTALWMTDMAITDTWQIEKSVSPSAYALGWAYFSLKGLLDKVGMKGRLGWIPTPQIGTTRQDYQVLLNAALATGSYLTIQTTADDPNITGKANKWFRPAVTHTNAALHEIRANRAQGYYDGGSARHEVFHFDSGVSTVALFDSIVPAAPGSKLEGRSFGVRVDQGQETCGPFQRCFRFSGEKRLLPNPDEPRLTEKGSFIHHPGFRSDGKSFTFSAWVRPRGAEVAGGIFERGPLAYGMFYNRNKFSGHFTPADGNGILGHYSPELYQPAGWNHIAVTYDADTKLFQHYINGSAQGGPLSTPWSDNFPRELPLFVGTRGDALSNFSGWMNEVRFYDRPLHADEVTNLFRDVIGGDRGIRSQEEPGDPSFVIGWSTESSPAALPELDVSLGGQRVAFLVPMLEGQRLPEELISLKFEGIEDVNSATVSSPVAVHEVIRDAAARTVRVVIHSSVLSDVPVRVEVR